MHVVQLYGGAMSAHVSLEPAHVSLETPLSKAATFVKHMWLERDPLLRHQQEVCSARLHSERGCRLQACTQVCILTLYVADAEPPYLLFSLLFCLHMTSSHNSKLLCSCHTALSSVHGLVCCLCLRHTHALQTNINDIGTST